VTLKEFNQKFRYKTDIENRGTSAASAWAENAARKVGHGWSKKIA